MGDEEQEERDEFQPFIRLTLTGAKPRTLQPEVLDRLEVSEGGVLYLGIGGETDVYSPSAWSLIETNLDL